MKFPHTVTRVRAGLVTGAYNQRTRDWGNAARAELAANVQPGASSEDVARQQRTDTFVRFYLPLGSDVVATDRYEWGGDIYEVDGDAQVWDRASRGHVHFVGRRTTQS